MTVNVLIMASISQMNCTGALKLKVCRLWWTWNISMSSCAALLTWSKQRNIICRQRNCIVVLFKFFFFFHNFFYKPVFDFLLLRVLTVALRVCKCWTWFSRCTSFENLMQWSVNLYDVHTIPLTQGGSFKNYSQDRIELWGSKKLERWLV